MLVNRRMQFGDVTAPALNTLPSVGLDLMNSSSLQARQTRSSGLPFSFEWDDRCDLLHKLSGRVWHTARSICVATPLSWINTSIVIWCPCTLGQDSGYCMSAPRTVRTQQFGYSLITVKGDVVLAGVQIRTPTFAHSSQHNQRPEGSSRWKASYQLGQPDRWQKLGRQWAFPR